MAAIIGSNGAEAIPSSPDMALDDMFAIPFEGAQYRLIIKQALCQRKWLDLLSNDPLSARQHLPIGKFYPARLAGIDATFGSARWSAISCSNARSSDRIAAFSAGPSNGHTVCRQSVSVSFAVECASLKGASG